MCGGWVVNTLTAVADDLDSLRDPDQWEDESADIKVRPCAECDDARYVMRHWGKPPDFAVPCPQCRPDDHDYAFYAVPEHLEATGEYHRPARAERAATRESTERLGASRTSGEHRHARASRTEGEHRPERASRST